MIQLYNNYIGYIANSQGTSKIAMILLTKVGKIMVKIAIEKGYYTFKLADILKEKNISINKLMKDTNTDYKVIKRLMTGELLRIDIIVLARLCDYLDCKITDIFDYKN